MSINRLIIYLKSFIDIIDVIDTQKVIKMLVVMTIKSLVNRSLERDSKGPRVRRQSRHFLPSKCHNKFSFTRFAVLIIAVHYGHNFY